MANIKKVNPYGYFDRALRQYFPTEKSKKEFMKAYGIKHDGSMESDKHRTDRLAAEINDGLRKKGQKTRTVQELVGNARKVKGPTKYFFMGK